MLTYYFPKSKRKLMAYVNLLNMQDMNNKDIDLFKVLEFNF